MVDLEGLWADEFIASGGRRTRRWVAYTPKSGLLSHKRQGPDPYGPSPRPYRAGRCRQMADFSTADHFSISLFTSVPSAACVRPSGFGISEPRSSRRFLTFS